MKQFSMFATLASGGSAPSR